VGLKKELKQHSTSCKQQVSCQTRTEMSSLIQLARHPSFLPYVVWPSWCAMLASTHPDGATCLTVGLLGLPMHKDVAIFGYIQLRSYNPAPLPSAQSHMGE